MSLNAVSRTSLRHIRNRSAICFALLSQLAANRAWAQTPESASSTAEASLDNQSLARAKFLRGVALVNEHNDPKAALDQFVESSRLFPTFVAGLNIAACLKELGRHAEALDQYDALLTNFVDTLTAEVRANVEAQRAKLLERFGELEVKVNEPGSSIVIDGAQRGTAPLLAPFRLEMGVHMIRITRDGFKTNEQQLSIAPGRRRTLEVNLVVLSGVGTLHVVETEGKVLDVVVDGAVLGQTPWRGNVSTGLHSVLLRGDGEGTPPTAVDITLKQGSKLELHAVVLDAESTIEPEPLGSTVYVDGVFAGNGTWTGALPAGRHRIEVIAPGYLDFRKEVALTKGTREHVRAKLAIDSSQVEQPLLGLYIEPSIGLLFGRSLRGSTDQACDCDSRSHPFGFLAGARVGYRVHRHAALELGGGYMHISEASTRQLDLISEPGNYGFRTDDFPDQLSLSGPFASLGLSARFLQRNPLTARMTTGLALLLAAPENSANVTGYLRGVGGAPDQPASGHLSIPEPTQQLLTPFVSTELRIGHYFSRRLSADIGVAISLFMPPTAERANRSGLASGPQSHDIGVLTLPDETMARAFLTLLPSLAGRFDL